MVCCVVYLVQSDEACWLSSVSSVSKVPNICHFSSRFTTLVTCSPVSNADCRACICLVQCRLSQLILSHLVYKLIGIVCAPG